LSKSCGCLRDELTRVRNRKYSLADKREYLAWAGIKKRCFQINCKSYPNYGGRGITLCDEWRDNFAQFLADMGRCPDGHTIDRIDNDGPYRPSNCRWASRSTQNSNTRRNHYIEFNGERHTLAHWARSTGMKHTKLLRRLQRGWSVERALTT
jgi:hypothetical protein